MTEWYCDPTKHDNNGRGHSPATAKKYPASMSSLIRSGDVVLFRRGYYYDSISGYFMAIVGKSNFTIGTYGEGPNPVFDSMVYEPPDATGWLSEGDGVWSKQLASKTAANGGVKRLFRGAYNRGNMIGQRFQGTAMRRARQSLNGMAIDYESVAVVKRYLNALDPWIWGGAKLGYRLFVYTGDDRPQGNPARFYSGLGMVHQDETAGFATGAFYAVQLIACNNVLIMGIDSHASPTQGFVVTNTVGSVPCENISILHCNSRYAYQGAVRVAPSIPNAVVKNFPVIDTVLVEDCVGDAGTSAEEQEPNLDYRNLSGAMDMFTVFDGAKNVTFRRCTSINSTHVAFCMGQYSLNHKALLTDNCGFEDCTMRAAPWTTYTRGFTTFGCLASCFIRNTVFDGQNVRCQVGGAVRVYGNTWVNMRASAQKRDTAGWISGAAEIVNRSGLAAWGNLRYVYVVPDGAVIAHNAVENPRGIPVQFETFNPHNYGVPEPTLRDGAITIVNNAILDTRSGLAETIRYVDRASVIGQQVIENNAIHRGGQGVAKVRRIRMNQSALIDLNSFRDCQDNLLADPLLDLSNPRKPRLRRGSPCRQAGKWLGNFHGHRGKALMKPPSIGPAEFADGS